MSRAVDGLVAYILDGQVKRLDRDVLKSLAQRVRDDEKYEPEEREPYPLAVSDVENDEDQHVSVSPTHRTTEDE